MTTNQALLTCKIQGSPFTGLIDTGADVSIIQRSIWPPEWSLTHATAVVSGTGGTQVPEQSAVLLYVKGPEKKVAILKPYVLDVPYTLWG